MSLIVRLVIGELDAVKADDLTHPRLSCARRVRVHVESRRDARVVRVPSHHPLRAVVHIPAGVHEWKSRKLIEFNFVNANHIDTPVAFGVHGHDVHGDIVLLARVKIAHFDAH